MENVRIAEIFHSIQGEGLLAGTPSVFVRTTGCNLRCWFCDTRYTSWEPEGGHVSVDAILEQVMDYACGHAVITGGEPLLQPDVVPLSQALIERGVHVTVETAATVFRPVRCDLLSISPKLSNSTPQKGNGSARGAARHESQRVNLPVLDRMLNDYRYQLKFVIDVPTDCEEVERFLSGLVRGVAGSASHDVARDRILLMPQGTSHYELSERARWLVPYCRKRGYRYCPRLHIERFGNVRGT